jgi:hypothetical protein
LRTALALQLELELEFNLSGKLFTQFETFQNINKGQLLSECMLHHLTMRK